MSKQVKIYSTPTCPQCQAAKRYFKDKGVEFQELDVASDARALVEMRAISQARSVPVIVINGRVFIGFDRAGIEKTLSEQD